VGKSEGEEWVEEKACKFVQDITGEGMFEKDL